MSRAKRQTDRQRACVCGVSLHTQDNSTLRFRIDEDEREHAMVNLTSGTADTGPTLKSAPSSKTSSATFFAVAIAQQSSPPSYGAYTVSPDKKTWKILLFFPILFCFSTHF